MQLKNNITGNIQLAFNRSENGKSTTDYVHIPGGATVEIDDKIFLQLVGTKTQVKEQKVVETLLTEDLTGADVKTGKEALKISEYFETGAVSEINMVRSMIKDGTLTVIVPPAVDEKVVDAFLSKNKVAIDGMSPEDKLAMYHKLAK